MQISSVPGGSWSNPAAQSQQVAGSNRTNASNNNNSPPTSGIEINDVEKTDVTQDRDANERYDGQSPRKKPQEGDAPAESSLSGSSSDSILDLPAISDSDGSTLDLMG